MWPYVLLSMPQRMVRQSTKSFLARSRQRRLGLQLPEVQEEHHDEDQVLQDKETEKMEIVEPAANVDSRTLSIVVTILQVGRFYPING